jgi:hypothetical protein
MRTVTLLAFVLVGCGGATVAQSLNTARDVCVELLATRDTVVTEAAKLGLTPVEVAQRICDAGLLAVQVAESHLAKQPDWLPLPTGGAPPVQQPTCAVAGAPMQGIAGGPDQ